MEGFEAQAFALEADMEYLTARLLLNSGAALATKGTYHAHTALEEILKSYIATKGQLPAQIHLLDRLAETAADFDDPWFGEESVVNRLRSFNRYQQLGRYGANANENSDPDRVESPNLQARGVIAIGPELLRDLDELYLTIRSKIGPVQIDGLSAIMEGRTDHLFTKGWGFPVSPEVALTTNNASTSLLTQS